MAASPPGIFIGRAYLVQLPGDESVNTRAMMLIPVVGTDSSCLLNHRRTDSLSPHVAVHVEVEEVRHPVLGERRDDCRALNNDHAKNAGGRSGLVSLFGRVLAPLEVNVSHSLSVSFRSLPKVIFLSVSDDPLVLAETLVHEADHNLLYAIDRRFGFWKSNEAYKPIHWSPWRDDPRPLDGNLRGASAFTTVSEFLLDLSLRGDIAPGQNEDALKRAILAAQQVRETLSILWAGGAGCITQAGRTFLGQLETRVQRVVESIPRTKQAQVFQEEALAAIKSRTSPSVGFKVEISTARI